MIGWVRFKGRAKLFWRAPCWRRVQEPPAQTLKLLPQPQLESASVAPGIKGRKGGKVSEKLNKHFANLSYFTQHDPRKFASHPHRHLDS